MTAATLISEFGTRIGQDGLRLDDQGTLQFLSDEHTLVTLEAVEDQAALFASAMVCRIPAAEADRLMLFDVLMEAHTFGLATQDSYFGTSTAKAQVLLFKRFDLASTDGNTLVSGLEQYLAVLEFWKGKLAEAGV